MGRCASLLPDKKWLKQDEIHGGRSGVTTAEAQRVKGLEGEVKELRRANEILKLASAFLVVASNAVRGSPNCSNAACPVGRPPASYSLSRPPTGHWGQSTAAVSSLPSSLVSYAALNHTGYRGGMLA